MIRLFREAWHLQEFLESRGWPFCFIGGIALQHWGEPRVTRDLDVTIFTGFGGEDPIIDELLSVYRARIPDAREFARRYRVLLLSTGNDVPVDVALAGLQLEAEMIDRASLLEFEPGVWLRICNAEDLFVLKAFADRVQDRADLVGIARRSGAQLDWDVIEQRLTPLAQAKEDASILDGVRRLRREFSS